MVDKEVIMQRMMKLEQAIRKLKEIARHSFAEYESSEALKDRAERNFQVAAQACIDMANHVVAARGLRTPEGYGDSFAVAYYCRQPAAVRIIGVSNRPLSRYFSPILMPTVPMGGALVTAPAQAKFSLR